MPRGWGFSFNSSRFENFLANMTGGSADHDHMNGSTGNNVLFGGASPQQAQWHTQLLPGLAIKAKPAKINGGKSTAVKFTVSDPDPVKGAKVSAAGRSETTNSSGHATIDLGPTKKRKLTASAKKAGYKSGSVRIKVK